VSTTPGNPGNLPEFYWCCWMARIHLCRVAGNTVWSHVASTIQ